mgnify:FL=1
MIRPAPEVLHDLVIIMRQYPNFVNFIKEWRQHELDQLPSVLQNTGRCQVLSELHKVITESPETVSAKSQ